MRNRHFLKVMAIVLTVCLEFGNLQMTAYASQVQDETTVTEEFDSAEADEQKGEKSEAEATKNSEETNSQETSTEEVSDEEVSDEEGLTEENSQEEVTEGVTTEENSTESESTEENSDEQISEEETSEEEITEDITTEEITEEISTEEETTEEETTEELTLEFMEEELLGAATPESDFTWNGTTITGYNGSAKNVVIPESAYAIASDAFRGNTTIESITFGKNIMEIGACAFYNCSNLKTVKFETTKIKRENGCGYYIFYGCNISKVEFAEDMTYIPASIFEGAKFQSGTGIVIPKNVTSIGDSAFFGASNLAKVTFAGNKVTAIGEWAFAGTSIKSIDLPESLCSIGQMAFYQCTSLTGIEIPKNVTSMGLRVFKDCSKLTTVKINATKLSCEYGAFYGCNINKVEFAEDMTYIPASIFAGAKFQAGTAVVIPKNVTRIGDYAFDGVSNLCKVTFAGSKVTEIGECAFSYASIDQIDLPESLCEIDTMAFYHCTSLTGIEIPKNVTSMGLKVFMDCSALTTVKINTTNLGCEYGIFYNCNNINKVEFAEDMTYIPASIFAGAKFQGGTAVVIPKNVTCIGDYAFYGASNLCKVTFAGNKVTKIGESAFAYTSIDQIDLPDSLQKIGSSAFYDCDALQEIIIPNKVESIGNYAFGECDGLYKVVLPASVNSLGYNTFGSAKYIRFYAVKDSYAYNWVKQRGFTLVESYSIAYNLNGGVNGSGNPTAYEKGESLSFKNPTREGYTFAGWYTDSSCTKKFSYTTSTTGNLTLYAKWNINTYNITYVVNGGTLAKNSPTTYTAAMEVALKEPTRTGYTFIGWYTDSKCSEANKVTKIEKGSAGNKTLYAGWKEYSYTIKFAPNGANVTGTQADMTDCAYSKNVTLTKCAYTRPGYTFAGWNTKADGKGTSYADKATVSKLVAKNNGSITLYATWKENTYSITYNLNGGTNHAKNPSNYTVTKSVTFSNPTRVGYTFQGWYSDAACTQKITAIKKGTTGAVTVYAKWEVNKYTIQFHANGGKGKMDKLAGCEYGKSYTLTKNAFTRDGYTFKGWNTNAKGTGTWYWNASSVKNLTDANNKIITLYAIWTENTYSITYNLNGGTNNEKNTSTYATVRGITFANPTRVGYTFKGWYSDAGCTQKITAIKKGTTGAVTVYAKWEVNKYTIQFNANGGKGKMDKLAGCEYGKSYTLTKNAFTRDGYTFKGWNTNAKGTGTWYWNASSVKNLTDANNKTIALYAIWTENTYSITYNLNGGTNNEKNTSTYATVRGITFANPTRVGYTFQGWYSDVACTQKITAIKKGTAGAVTVYAKWEVNKYHIQFNANGGKGKMDKLAGCEYGKSYTLTKNAFTRDGYTFKGWNTNAKGTGTWYWNASSVKNLTDANNKTIMLYAIWAENTYSITYNLNGGTNNAKNPTTYATVRGASLANPTKEGYTFKGWYTDWSCTQKITAIKRGTAGAVTVYAKWEANKYTIQFNANGGTGKMDRLTGCEYGKSYTLTKNAFTKAGYTFKGWNTNAKGTGTWYWNASSVKNLTTANNKTVILYAIWVKN